MNRALFIVAHPDDAELAAGGTIKMLVEAGYQVKVITLTVSEKSGKTRQLRMNATNRAAHILGYDPVWYQDGAFDHVADIKHTDLVRYFDEFIHAYKPEMVFSHWDGDSHHDHVCTAKAVLSSSRRWKADLYAFPPNELKTAAFLRFVANTFVDITPFIEHKVEAIRQYSYPGQHFKALDEQHFRHINRSYGIQIGSEYAESFLLLRREGLGTSQDITQKQEPNVRSKEKGSRRTKN